jgi:hypothetical protein
LSKSPNWIEAAVPAGTPVDCYTRLTAEQSSQLGARGRVAWAREQRDKKTVKHVHACIHGDMHDECRGRGRDITVHARCTPDACLIPVSQEAAEAEQKQTKVRYTDLRLDT